MRSKPIAAFSRRTNPRDLKNQRFNVFLVQNVVLFVKVFPTVLFFKQIESCHTKKLARQNTKPYE